MQFQDQDGNANLKMWAQIPERLFRCPNKQTNKQISRITLLQTSCPKVGMNSLWGPFCRLLPCYFSGQCQKSSALFLDRHTPGVQFVRCKSKHLWRCRIACWQLWNFMVSLVKVDRFLHQKILLRFSFRCKDLLNFTASLWNSTTVITLMYIFKDF